MLAATVLATMAISMAGGDSYWERRGCDHGHPSRVAYRMERELLRNYRPLTRRTKRRAHHYAVCVATRAKAHEAHERARGHYRWRHSYGPRWEIRLRSLPAWTRAWAWSTSWCESRRGQDPNTNRNGYVGRFQWVWSTWWDAGGEGHPSAQSYAYEAVHAIRYMLSHGAQHWPNCGR